MVAIPLILDSRFSAVLSDDSMIFAKPDIVIIFWFGLILEPSFFRIFTWHPLEAKMYFAYCTPAITPSCLEIMLAVIFFLGKRLLVMSPFPISSAKKLSSAFFALGCNLGYLERVLAHCCYSQSFCNYRCSWVDNKNRAAPIWRKIRCLTVRAYLACCYKFTFST